MQVFPFALLHLVVLAILIQQKYISASDLTYQGADVLVRSLLPMKKDKRLARNVFDTFATHAAPPPTPFFLFCFLFCFKKKKKK